MTTNNNLTYKLAVSANDGKVQLENGVVRAIKNPAPDTVSIIDLTCNPPTIIADVEAPTSVAGPPFAVAVTPDESLALISAATRVDPADTAKIISHNLLSVIDLKTVPPRVIQTLESGVGASGISINAAGTLALVANRGEGTVAVFTIKEKALSPAGKLQLGDAKSSPSHVVITPDGSRALVTRDGDHGLTLLRIDGSKVEVTDRTFYAGFRPYGADITPDGAVAVVACMGRGQGDVDTVSVIDLRAEPPRTVNTISVGAAPEGIKLSADGRWCAVVVQEGSNRPAASPFYNSRGKLILLELNGTQLTKIAEAPIGGWSQGAAFSADGRTILVQNMVERNIQVFNFDGNILRETDQIPLKGGGAAIRTAGR
jgi:DNA-binding beta-propeller fold protein YncE